MASQKYFLPLLRELRFSFHLYLRGRARHLGLDMLPIHDETHNSKAKPFVVLYHVRGRRKRQPLTSRCHTVQDIIDLGQRSFAAFAERNPWICIDSKHATVFVGLDPECQARKGSAVGTATVRNVSFGEESSER
jgi:hypothetical protein